MLKYNKILIVVFILIFFLSSCTEEYDECDLNKDGKVDLKEREICEQQKESCGPDNNGYCIDFREECRTGYEGIGPDKCRRGRSADCCVPVE